MTSQAAGFRATASAAGSSHPRRSMTRGPLAPVAITATPLAHCAASITASTSRARMWVCPPSSMRATALSRSGGGVGPWAP